MHAVLTSPPDGTGLDAGTADFYRGVLSALQEARLPFVVGGAYAFNFYTGINRATSDLDLFIRRSDFEQAASALQQAGYEVELTFPHWLGKIHWRGIYIDLIFSSGNGIAVVDDLWFEHGDKTALLGYDVRLSPVEEMIWSKAYIMERERFDGADIAHLLLASADRIDWKRLLWRFGEHWRVLLAHLVLFGFVYPADRQRVPAWVMDELLSRLKCEPVQPAGEPLCLGTLLSREQYLSDVHEQGLRDGRLPPYGNMSAEDTASWTDAISQRD